MIHALRTHAKRTLAAAFAAAFALSSALTLSACSGKPAKSEGRTQRERSGECCGKCALCMGAESVNHVFFHF